MDVIVQNDGDYATSAHRLILAAYSRHLDAALSSVQDSAVITLNIDPKITGKLRCYPPYYNNCFPVIKYIIKLLKKM